eukprot:gene2096-5150_t
MARKALPILLLNLNCEMLYVIEERLIAQRVAADKAIRVREDLISAMFDREFIRQMFKPQPIYDQAQLMAMLQHFSQATIIRLSPRSLSKLYDLMIMTLKYQFLLSKSSRELLAITLNHLETVRDTPGLSITSRKLVQQALKMVLEEYSNLCTGGWHRIRHVIGCLLQDKHTRVALFQQAQYQGKDGRFVLPRTGPAAPNCVAPGFITFGRDHGNHRLFRSKFEAPQVGIDYLDPTNRSCELGKSLYALARQGLIPGVEVPDSGDLTEIHPATEKLPPTQLKADTPQALKNSNATALRSLDLLARLVGGHRHQQMFPLLLFGTEYTDDDSLDTDDAFVRTDEDVLQGEHSVLHVEAISTMDGLEDIIKEFNEEVIQDHATTSPGDDLLSMLDALEAAASFRLILFRRQIRDLRSFIINHRIGAAKNN